MLATWTVLRSRTGLPACPWEPDGATWWQAGPSSAGRAQAPVGDGRWWSVLATWDDDPSGPQPVAGLDVWHVVLDAVACRGDVVAPGGHRPFAALPSDVEVEGPAVLVTFAGASPDDAREREFFRWFRHISRDVESAPGHRVSLVQVAGEGVVLTFSAWDSSEASRAWAHVRAPHAGAVARQRSHGLVSTSGSVLCAVRSSTGVLGDVPDPLAGR